MSKFLCDLPWAHLSVMPHGVTSVCCEANHHNHMSHAKTNGNLVPIHNNSIDDVINSDSYKQIRLDMLNGKVPETCKGCYKTEKAGGTSKRITDSEWKYDWKERTGKDGSIDLDIRSVELRLGNYCNLRCRSCNAESSTSWIKEYNLLKNKIDLPSDWDLLQQSKNFDWSWTDDDDFYNKLFDASPNLENIFISGGEPFLVPKHFDWLSKLVKNNKTNINLSYHTNLNYDLNKIRSQLEMMSNFKSVRLNLSIDDIGARNTYIRNPSNWNLTVKNLLEIQEKYKTFKLRVCQTINAYNFMYVEDLYNFLPKGIDLYYNHIHEPAYQSANILNIEHRKNKIQSLNLPYWLLNDLQRYTKQKHTKKNQKTFLKFTKLLDKSRNESFEKLFPKTVEALV